MQREFEREQEAVQRDYSTRLNEIAAPVYEDIRRSLKAVAESRGITILIDAGSMSCPIGCNVESAADLNITRAFIAETSPAPVRACLPRIRRAWQHFPVLSASLTTTPI